MIGKVAVASFVRAGPSRAKGTDRPGLRLVRLEDMRRAQEFHAMQ